MYVYVCTCIYQHPCIHHYMYIIAMHMLQYHVLYVNGKGRHATSQSEVFGWSCHCHGVLIIWHTSVAQGQYKLHHWACYWAAYDQNLLFILS